METAKKKTGRPLSRKPVRFELSISQEAKEALERRAKEELRPMTAVACSILEQVLANSGTAQPVPEEEAKPKRIRTGGRISEGATALLTISLQPELKTAVQEVARSENRTTSNMACLMLRDWIMDYEYRNSKKETGNG